jgi:hypothetical protein
MDLLTTSKIRSAHSRRAAAGKAPNGARPTTLSPPELRRIVLEMID